MDSLYVAPETLSIPPDSGVVAWPETAAAVFPQSPPTTHVAWLSLGATVVLVLYVAWLIATRNDHRRSR